MKYRPLGRTGLLVSHIVLGAANFGQSLDEAAATQLVRTALDSGVNTVDTADVYTAGASEQIIGKAIKDRREQVILCTKVGSRVGDAGADLRRTIGSDRLDHAARWQAGIAPTDNGLSRKHLIAGLEASLRRLQTDYIDVYQLHRFDLHTGIEEVLRTLDLMVTSGKVRYVGCSGWAAWQLYRSLWVSDVKGLVRFHSLQVPYSILERGPERETLPACAAAQVGVLAFRSLAGGLLSGRYLDGSVPDGRSRLGSREGYRNQYLTEPMRAGAGAVADFARETGRTSAQASLGWVLAQPSVGAAVVGASSPTQFAELVGAGEAPLSVEEVGVLSEKVRQAVAAAEHTGPALAGRA
jgi:aryl-alcohol dehydrogenase-like predicted oxidoreductase